MNFTVNFTDPDEYAAAIETLRQQRAKLENPVDRILFDNDPLTAPREALIDYLAVSVEEALTDPDMAEVELAGIGRYVAERIVEDCNTIHTDACPGCGNPISYHPLDPPPLCPCNVERERYQPALFVGGWNAR